MKSKSTSLQAWSKLTEKYFHKKLRIEARKDREHIYQILTEMGLEHEKLVAFYPKRRLSRDDFKRAINLLGTPFWISASPLLGEEKINRLTYLNIKSIDEGWELIKNIENLDKYKLLVLQYPTEVKFKGSALISRNGNGIAEFVRGDHHFDLISGKHMADPMVFDRKGIKRLSKTVDLNYQNELFNCVSNHNGHFEFQYGFLNEKMCLSFFDYNDEIAYEEIDEVIKSLVNNSRKEGKDIFCRGLTACIGFSEGFCRVILSSEIDKYSKLKEEEVLVTDITTPDMTPLMARASAIITDLGGVTSHAAIVCRELNIPCIVGVVNATKVLKDGMKVKVNATDGIVLRD